MNIVHVADILQAGTLLIAFATTSKQLRTVRALIDWGQQKTNEKVPLSAIPLNPTVKTRHLAVTSWLHDSPGEGLNASNMESSMAQLSQLEFLSPYGDPQGRMTPPTILTVRSHLPASRSHYNQDVHTIVDRWEVKEKLQTIHPAFEQLSSRRNSVGSQQPGVRLSIPFHEINTNILDCSLSEETRELHRQQNFGRNTALEPG